MVLKCVRPAHAQVLGLEAKNGPRDALENAGVGRNGLAWPSVLCPLSVGPADSRRGI
jgi:hypothetical protein